MVEAIPQLSDNQQMEESQKLIQQGAEGRVFLGELFGH